MNEILPYIATGGAPTLLIILAWFFINERLKSQEVMLKNYQEYIKTVSWKDVKEHYEDIKMPHAIAIKEKEIVDYLDKEFEQINPVLDKLIADYEDALKFVVHVSMWYLTKSEAMGLVREKMPGSEQYLQALWVWFDENKPDTPKSPGN